MRSRFSQFTFTWLGQMFSTGVSIGHVHFEDGTLDAGEILSKADEACYVAKDPGRNRLYRDPCGNGPIMSPVPAATDCGAGA